MANELQTLDIKILEQLQRDALMSTSELAERLGMSQSPCWRRLQRLREEGYIQRQVAILDRSKFGSSIFVFATLKMSTLTDEQREDFARKVELCSEIIECHTIFGERDILLKIYATSLDWYQNFIFKVIMKLPGVVDVQSTVTLTELKSTTAIPVRGARAM